MTRSITAASPPRHRSLLAVPLIAILGAATLSAIQPTDADAAKPRCNFRELCLYTGDNLTGGLYHFSGSDSNLHNDRFEGGFFSRGRVVANAAKSVWNHGGEDPSGRNDVALYTLTGFRGGRACVKLGQGGFLRSGFQKNIESYRWVNRKTCNSMWNALHPDLAP